MKTFILSVIVCTALAVHFATAQQNYGRSLSENSIPDACRRRLQSNFFQTGGQSSYGCVLHEPQENGRTRATNFCMTCRFPYFYTSDQVKDQIRTSTVDALRLESNRFNKDSSLTVIVNGTDDVYDFMSIFARDARNRDIYNSLDNVFYFFRNGSIGLAQYNNGMQTGDIDCETCRTVSGRDLIDLPRACTNGVDRRSGDGACTLHHPDRSQSSSSRARGMPPYNRDETGSGNTEYCITCKFSRHASDREINDAISSLADGMSNSGQLENDARLYFVFDPAHQKYDLRNSLKNYRDVMYKVNMAYHFFPNGTTSVQTWHGAGAIPENDRGLSRNRDNNYNRDSNSNRDSYTSRDRDNTNNDRDYNNRNSNNMRDSSSNRDNYSPNRDTHNNRPNIQPTNTRGRYDYDQSPSGSTRNFDRDRNYNNIDYNRGGRYNSDNNDDALNDVVVRPTTQTGRQYHHGSYTPYTGTSYSPTMGAYSDVGIRPTQTRGVYLYTPYPDTYSPTIGIYTQTRFGEQIPSDRYNRDEINFSDQRGGISVSPKDQQPPSCSARVTDTSSNSLCHLHQPMMGDSSAMQRSSNSRDAESSNKQMKYYCITCRSRRDSSQRDIEDAIQDLSHRLMRNQEFLSSSSNENGKIVVVLNSAHEYFSLRDLVRSHPQLEYALDRAIFLFQNGSSAVTRYSTSHRTETGAYGPDIQYTRTYSTDRQEERFTNQPYGRYTRMVGPQYDEGTGTGNDQNNNNNVVISTITITPGQRNQRVTRTITVTAAPGANSGNNNDNRPAVRQTAFMPQFASDAFGTSNDVGSSSSEEQQTVCFVVRKGQQTGRAVGVSNNRT